MARVPSLELLWWEGCPSTARALSELQAAATQAGIAGAEVALREIRTDGDAQQAGFVGSPTILIDGVDPFAGGGLDGVSDDVVGGPPEPAGLSCRVYRRRDGRVSPTPDPLDLRDALAAAAARCATEPGAARR